MTNESNFPAVFFEDFLAALRKVQDENRIHGNVEVFELRPSPDGAVHLGVSWPSIGTVPPEEAKKFAEEVARAAAAPRVSRGAPQGKGRKGGSLMVRDIHDYDSLKEAYDVLLMFERFPGPVRSECVEEFVTQLKRDIREYVNRVSDCHIIRDELDSFVELVKLPEKLSPLSKESVLEWFYMHRAYRDDRYDGMGCSGQFFTTRVRLFRRRGCWYAYHFVSVDM